MLKKLCSNLANDLVEKFLVAAKKFGIEPVYYDNTFFVITHLAQVIKD